MQPDQRLTEAQAREKWCPFARVLHIEQNHHSGSDTCASYNRDLSGKDVVFPTAADCIASDCMAWRWWTPGQSGYCGLAGSLSQ